MRTRLDEPSWWYGAGQGAWAGIAPACLAPVAALYGWAARARYRRGKPYRSRLPVICVGNLTAGGTGKTPLTLHLCAHLSARGLHPAVLTRGYGGSRAGPHWVAEDDGADAVGDEALLLARAAPTLVARERAAGARAIEQVAGAGPPADVIVMDDGLQNPQLAKSLTLAMVDGARGLGNGRVMPAGPLRAPLAFQLGLVDAIVVNEREAGAGDAVAHGLRQRFDGPILRCATVPAGDTAWLKGQRMVAWAGIGNPQRFFAMLRALGAHVMEEVTFGDHQRLAPKDAGRLLALAQQRAATLVSTEKDLVRLKGGSGLHADLATATKVLPIVLRFAEMDAERLAAMLETATRPLSPLAGRGLG